MRGVIDRRILVNYRVDPGVLAPLLSASFRPKVHRGFGMAGICLIRLRDVRPAGLPAWLGIGSENAAHRTAIEWEDGGRVHPGVYVRRRDTSSWLNAAAGGRLFPGIHSHARFEIAESATRVSVALRSDDGATHVCVAGDLMADLPDGSIFESLAEASAFFQAGSLGWSATSEEGRFHGLELRCRNWSVAPLAVSSVESSYFDDRATFPAGSIELDCALLMRGVEHEWHGRADLCCETARQGAPR